MRRASKSLLVALWLAAAALPAQQNLEPSGFINDYAGVLSSPMEATLEALTQELQQKTGAEMAVAIVGSLEGESVEGFANLLGERWGVGDQDDRGALLLIAIEDRQMRLEVGYGLEPILPDGRAGQILDVMTPLLRQGDYDTAVALGVSETAQIIGADAGVTLTGIPENVVGRRRRTGPGFFPWIWLILILVLALWPRRRRRGAWNDDAVTTAWWLGNIGGRGGGGGGGGWSSGGGFGGFGGGGFGGGGASRGW